MDTNWGTTTFGLMLASQLPRTKIVHFCKRLAMAHDGSDEPWVKDVERLSVDVEQIMPLVLPADFATGIDMLRGIAFTKTGAVSKCKLAEEFVSQDRDVLMRADRIHWVGTRVIWGSNLARTQVLPIFRVIAPLGTNGMFFDYVKAAWQSGGTFEVVARGAL